MRRALFSVLFALAVAGCTTAPSAPTGYSAFAQTDLTVGTGTTASTGQSVTVEYTGWLYDPSKPDQKGLEFDSTMGRTPFTFTLGAGQVIKGWDNGVVGMKVGGVRRLVIPPSLAYGATRNGPVPPYATLIFDITLDGIAAQ